MSVDEFGSHYWMKAELITLARQLDLRTDGYKPDLVERIERRLRGLPDLRERTQKRPKGQRDSKNPLVRNTAVVNYKSDDKTRAFFKSQIGPHFHFTYQLNQYRLTHESLTYGDLVDEWIAEYNRCKDPNYQAPIASQGEYNQHVRDFFADKQNNGKSFRDAVASWNEAKRTIGERRYRPQPKKGGRKP
jgi:hypothetical protein